MAKTIYQQLRDGASAQSIRDAFWTKVTKIATTMRNDLGVDLLNASVVRQMKQELDDEITRAEARINKEDNKTLENKRKEVINTYIDYLAVAANDDTILELKNDDDALAKFYSILASIEKSFVSTFGMMKKNKNKPKMNPDKTLQDWLKSL
jgi:hypothetical protein